MIDKLKTMGWTTGRRCNVIDPESGRVIHSNLEVISDPFLFHGNFPNEICIMVLGINGCVPLDCITEPLEQVELFAK